MMRGNRVFIATCSVLGLVACSQLIIAGLALAVRFENGQQVRIVEREVEKIVPIRVTVPAEIPVIPERAAPAPPIALPPEDLAFPAIADPRTGQLAKDGRKARIAGDMGMAIMKLEEALTLSKEEPAVLFELGMVHEAMGLYGKASRYYESVFNLGLAGAGEFYPEAAAKLRDGFEQPTDLLGKIALGRVRIFNDKENAEGQRVILTIPVEKASGEEVDSQKIEVAVTFFNKTNKGKIIQLEDQSWALNTWVSLPFDWAGGEETLRMDYRIPVRDTQTAHLFGTLAYYGQVVTLSYNGEILDVQAWPRDLAARIGQADDAPVRNGFPEFLDQDILPPNFDPSIPLLNPLIPE